MPLSTIDNTGLSQSQIITAVNMPTGSVIQVVQGTIGGGLTTSSTSFVSLGLTASITPQFSTSKILIAVTLVDVNTPGAGDYVSATTYRNSTNLAGGSGITQSFGLLYSPGSSVQSNLSWQYLDSPATTSSTTYTVYWGVNAGTGTINANGQTSIIILKEIR